MTVKVSVVMPAYNHEAFVRRAIGSVLDQEYPDVELVVIDDGSSDNTWSEIQRAHAETTKPFLALRQDNAGVSKTLNRGVRASSGELIAVLASDDYYLPGKLAAQALEFENGSASLGLVHTGAVLDYQNGMPAENITYNFPPARGLCFDELLDQSMRVIAPTVMFRRSVFDIVGGFDESLAAEDVDFFVRVAAAGYVFAYIPQPFVVKTSVENSGGKQLKRLRAVHDKIIEKHTSQLAPARKEELVAKLDLQFVGMHCVAGDYAFASRLALDSARAHRSLQPLVKLLVWGSRSAALRALPVRARHRLRQAREGFNALRGALATTDRP